MKQKKLNPKQILRRNRKELKQKTERLNQYLTYFKENKDKLNDCNKNIECKRSGHIVTLGVCLARKFNLFELVSHRECKKCVVYINEYMDIIDNIES